MSASQQPPHPRGQTMIIAAVALVALVGMVGVVIDIGMQWADNRGSQNGTDATAEAGAIVVLEQMAGANPAKTDADVRLAVDRAAALNGIAIDNAQYVALTTNADGSVSPVPINKEVGSGGSIPGNAQGVRVVGTRTHETVFARVVGVTELQVFNEAIAVAGPSDPCPETGACALLPVTFPVWVTTCDGQNRSVPPEVDEDGDYPAWIGPPDAPDYIIPLCGNNPGSVGWIDWTPPPGSSGPGGGGGGGGGGDAELAAEICDPDPPDITLPDWFYVTSTGNTNSVSVQTCFERWIGHPILVPLFDMWCRSYPGGPNEPCDDPLPVAGINQWYHFPHFASFYLTGVYIQGNNSSVCDPSGGNGATSCLTGRFEHAALTGPVSEWVGTGGDNPPPSMIFAVQLIR
jgi:hypothetical protein